MIRKLFLLLQPAVLAVALLAGVGCSGGPSPSGDVPAASAPPIVKQSQSNTIGIGDELEVFVKEDAVFNGTYRVRERGDIIIPDIGRIPVAGMDVESAERRVESYIEKGQIKNATVILDRTSSTTKKSPLSGARQMLVYMTGAVVKPGQHMLTLPEGRSLGVYEAILISGGLGRFADEQNVYITRVDSKGIRHRIPVNTRLIRQGSSADPAIGYGDVVVVPEKVFGF
ncbi:polysaccharide biosynthesis/export family protein [Luteolibacter sp. SL250]|uniref:polysaccharide biosynthesis/export family protein n=1 Tax=Luteolibacter sp. SL250 TaxID=2995170 RepID=UPI00226EB871|nr:polysaccharide biosynthesis/export family protein [Luteolibacter sp. SL250]WAC19640.1 polysaccharide biosynthesis/export family protein [Luteolibacter sp. SL250]